MSAEQDQQNVAGDNAHNEQTKINSPGEDSITDTGNKDQPDNIDDASTLTIQGSSSEREENLGGTTNLSLEQLKATGDNDSINDENALDDLNEIRAVMI